MRKIEVIFSQADKELTERLRRRHKKLADKYLALNHVFTIIAGIALIAGIVLGVIILHSSSLIFAGIISLLISYVFQMMHNNCFIDALRYQFMFEHMQEISKYGNSLELSVSRTCPNTVTYNLPNCRCRYIEAINNIPTDCDVIITIKENVDAKNRISLDWYGKAV